MKRQTPQSRRRAPKQLSPGKKDGRPELKISWKELEKLCSFHCTLEEIAGWFGCSPDTIERRIEETHGLTFAEFFRQKRAKGLISIRRRQVQVALGDPARQIPPTPSMLIWLGKQYLGQSDNHTLKGTIKHESEPMVNPIEEFKQLLIKLLENPDIRDELNGDLKPYGLCILKHAD